MLHVDEEVYSIEPPLFKTLMVGANPLSTTSTLLLQREFEKAETSKMGYVCPEELSDNLSTFAQSR